MNSSTLLKKLKKEKQTPAIKSLISALSGIDKVLGEKKKD